MIKSCKFAFIIVMMILLVSKTLQATIISEDLTEPTAWTLGNSPYIVTVNVTASALLEILPGVEVRFQEGTQLVANMLTAQGLEESPIKFVGRAGAIWHGIVTKTGGQSILENVVIESVGNGYCALQLEAPAIVKNCTISQSILYDAICVPDTAVSQIYEISGNVISSGRNGIVISSTNPINVLVSSNQIECVEHAIKMYYNMEEGHFDVEYNVITASSTGISIVSAAKITVNDNSITSSSDAIMINSFGTNVGEQVTNNVMVGRFFLYKAEVPVSLTVSNNLVKDTVVFNTNIWFLDCYVTTGLLIENNQIINSQAIGPTPGCAALIRTRTSIYDMKINNTEASCALFLQGQYEVGEEVEVAGAEVQFFTGLTLILLSGYAWNINGGNFANNNVVWLVDARNVDWQEYPISVSNNYWGTTDGNEIQSKFVDIFQYPKAIMVVMQNFFDEQNNLIGYTNPNYIDVPTEWNTPTTLTSSVVVSREGSLTIRSDVTFEGTSFIVCLGKLIIEGTPSEKVHITSAGLWGGIYFQFVASMSQFSDNEYIDGSYIHNAALTRITGYISLNSAITAETGALNIQNVDIDSAAACITFINQEESELFLTNSSLNCGSELNAVTASAVVTMHHNSITSNFGVLIHQGPIIDIQYNTFEVSATALKLGSVDHSTFTISHNNFTVFTIGIELSNFQSTSYNYTISDNLFTGYRPLVIGSDENSCATGAYTVQFRDNVIISEGTSNYVIEVYTQTTGSDPDLICHYEIVNNDFRGSYGTDALLYITASEVYAVENKFDNPYSTLLSFRLQNGQMDFTRNDFNTIDYTTIKNAINDVDDSSEFGEVLVNPVFDRVAQKYYDIDQQCTYEELGGQCIYSCTERIVNGLVCDGHGDCTSPQGCSCYEGYAGTACTSPVCYGWARDDPGKACSGHGLCGTPDNCTCYDGYYSEECSMFDCFGVQYDQSQSVCNSNGVCQGPDQCVCNSGWVSPNCALTERYINVTYSEISSCDPVFIQARIYDSENDDLPVSTDYTWTLISPSSGSLQDYLGSQTSSSITISLGELMFGTDYNISITNELQYTPTEYASFTTERLNVLLNVPQFEFGQVGNLTASLDLPSCLLGSSVSFSWAVEGDANPSDEYYTVQNIAPGNYAVTLTTTVTTMSGPRIQIDQAVLSILPPKRIVMTFDPVITDCMFQFTGFAQILDSDENDYQVNNGYSWTVNATTAFGGPFMLADYLSGRQANILLITTNVLEYGASYTIEVANYNYDVEPVQFTIYSDRLPVTINGPATAYTQETVQFTASVSVPTCFQGGAELLQEWALYRDSVIVDSDSSESFNISTSSLSPRKYTVQHAAVINNRYQYDTAEFTVVARDLELTINGTSSMQLEFGQSVTFFASALDPDAPANNLIFVWLCSRFGQPCPATTDDASTYIFVPEDTGEYNITCVVYSSDYSKSASESRLVTVIDARPKYVVLYANPRVGVCNSSVSIVASVTDGTNFYGANSYTWRLVSSSSNGTLLQDYLAQQSANAVDIQAALLNFGSSFTLGVTNNNFGLEEVVITLEVDSLDIKLNVSSSVSPQSQNALFTASLENASCYSEAEVIFEWSIASPDGQQQRAGSGNNITAAGLPVGSYIATVTAKIGARFQRSQASFVVNLPAPKVTILSVLPSVISRTERVVLEAAVEPALDRSQITLRWSLIEQQSSINLIQRTTLLTNTASRNLVFIPTGLVEQRTYIVRITAFYTRGSLEATDEIVFSIAPRVNAGVFSVSPTSGSQYETIYSFTASGWSTAASATPLKYTYEFLDPNGIYIPLARPSTLPVLSSRLVANPNNITLIRCRVSNIFGAEQFFTLPVTVRAERPSNSTALLASLLQNPSAANAYQLVIAANVASGSLDSIRSVLTALQGINGTDSDTVDFVKQKSQILKVASSSALNVDTKLQVLNLVDGIFAGPSDDDVKAGVGDVISNLILPSDEYSLDLEQETSRIVDGFSSFLLSSKIAGENATIITTDTFEISVTKSYVSELEYSYNSDEIGVNFDRLPDFYNDTDSEVSVEFIKFTNTDGVLWTSRNANISSGIVSFKFIDSNGEKIALEFSDENPLVITLNRNVDEEFNGTFSCRYLNDYTDGTESWQTNGCFLHSVTDTQIICHCNHTTSFAAFVQFSKEDLVPPSKIQTAVYYVSVCMYSVFFIISALVFIILIINRNVQPVLSRSFGPYICMIAIMVECILLVIRNGLWLAKSPNTTAINSVGYIILIVSNPLSILSIFIFFWQMVRFIMLTHAYRIMSFLKAKTGNNQLRILKFFTKRVVFAILSAIVYAASFVYFLVYTVACWARESKLSKNILNANTIALAVSYSGIVILIGLGILVAFVYDSVVVPLLQRTYKTAVARAKQTAISDEEIVIQNNADEQQPKDKQQKDNVEKPIIDTANLVKEHLLRDDPLLFRINSIIMILSVLAMIVSYAIGIGNQYLERSDSSAIMIVSLVFDLCYTAIRILAYGAFVASASIYYKYQSYGNAFAEFSQRNPEDEETRGDNSELNIMSMIESVINNRVGYEIFKEYCTKEFSVENLLIWSTLRAMNFEWIVTSNEGREEMMESLLNRYIKSGSPYEVNIPSTTKKSVLNLAKTLHETSVNEQMVTLQKLTTCILTNLSDTFSRFSDTDDYAQFVSYYELHKVLENLMNDEDKPKIAWFSYELIQDS